MRIAALGGMRSGFPEHFMRHVHPNHPPYFSHGMSRKKTIKAGPTAEIKDGLPRP
jgi:hypothetical protein